MTVASERGTPHQAMPNDPADDEEELFEPHQRHLTAAQFPSQDSLRYSTATPMGSWAQFQFANNHNLRQSSKSSSYGSWYFHPPVDSGTVSLSLNRDGIVMLDC